MPAYFSILCEFDKNTISKSFVRDFFDCLDVNGVHFLKSCRSAEGYTLDELIVVNQNYVSGKALHNGSMYQAYFLYGDFSEVRGYWSVYDEKVFFDLIMPEDDFYEYTDEGVIEYRDKMKRVKEMAICVWSMTPVRIIQSSWECSEVPPYYSQISENVMPQTEPFSIVDIKKFSKQWKAKTTKIANDGILMEVDDNWFWI